MKSNVLDERLKKFAEQWVIRKKVVDLFLNITTKKEEYKTQLAANSNLSWSHSNNLLKDFEKYKLIEVKESKANARNKIIVLTQKGEKIKKCLEKLRNFYENKS